MKPKTESMPVEEAIKVVNNRNGSPREDDWELIDAATALKQKLTKTTRIKKISSKSLKTMAVGDCCLFTEPETTKNAGASSQAFASRCGIKIRTTGCFVLIPKTTETFKAVIVERLA